MKHLIFIQNNEEGEYKLAKEGKVGDYLLHHDGQQESRQEIVDISRMKTIGRVTPLTRSGTVRVEGYLASCYTEVNDHHKA